MFPTDKFNAVSDITAAISADTSNSAETVAAAIAANMDDRAYKPNKSSRMILQ